MSARDLISEADERWMRLAMREAERARGQTRPNPVVGAVIVKGGQLLARGHHRRAGTDHAEVAALRKLGGKAPGATLYVTLEPCCHEGRTGPCTEAVIAAGIKRVVLGCRDANPLVDGKGIRRLRRAGIQVDEGCLTEACYAQNRAFFTWVAERRPLVTLKAAVTLDGFIAARDGTSRWITGEESRQVVHEMRAAHDAILVGSGTVLADDPELTTRLPLAAAARKGRSTLSSPSSPANPVRVILDARLRTPPTARLFTASAEHQPLIITAETKSRRSARVAALQQAGADVCFVPRPLGRNQRGLPLREVLRLLAERNIQSLLVEGGSAIHGAFIDARLVDRVAFFIAPRLLGAGISVVSGTGFSLAEALPLGPLQSRSLGGDILLTADVVRAAARPSPSRSR